MIVMQDKTASIISALLYDSQANLAKRCKKPATSKGRGLSSRLKSTYILSMISWPNSLHFSLVAPSIRRSKS